MASMLRVMALVLLLAWCTNAQTPAPAAAASASPSPPPPSTFATATRDAIHESTQTISKLVQGLESKSMECATADPPPPTFIFHTDTVTVSATAKNVDQGISAIQTSLTQATAAAQQNAQQMLASINQQEEEEPKAAKEVTNFIARSDTKLDAIAATLKHKKDETVPTRVQEFITRADSQLATVEQSLQDVKKALQQVQQQLARAGPARQAIQDKQSEILRAIQSSGSASALFTAIADLFQDAYESLRVAVTPTASKPQGTRVASSGDGRVRVASEDSVVAILQRQFSIAWQVVTFHLLSVPDHVGAVIAALHARVTAAITDLVPPASASSIAMGLLIVGAIFPLIGSLQLAKMLAVSIVQREEEEEEEEEALRQRRQSRRSRSKKEPQEEEEEEEEEPTRQSTRRSTRRRR